eukprot:COSAG05_NODE_21045_length_275_cov_0.568182_1_plen_78_part_01
MRTELGALGAQLQPWTNSAGPDGARASNGGSSTDDGDGGGDRGESEKTAAAWAKEVGLLRAELRFVLTHRISPYVYDP